MRRTVLSLCLLAIACPACECGQKSDQYDGRGYPIPLAGLPLSGHGAARQYATTPARQLSRDELLAVAYDFNPRIDPADFTRLASSKICTSDRPRRAGYRPYNAPPASGSLPGKNWSRRSTRDWATAGAASLSGTTPILTAIPHMESLSTSFRAGPKWKPNGRCTFGLSQLIPYYYYYEKRTKRTSFSTDAAVEQYLPPYHISTEFEPVVALIESLMARHYGYFRLDAELCETPVPGIFIPEHLGDDPPKLRDALFGPPLIW